MCRITDLQITLQITVIKIRICTLLAKTTDPFKRVLCHLSKHFYIQFLFLPLQHQSLLRFSNHAPHHLYLSTTNAHSLSLPSCNVIASSIAVTGHSTVVCERDNVGGYLTRGGDQSNEAARVMTQSGHPGILWIHACLPNPHLPCFPTQWEWKYSHLKLV